MVVAFATPARADSPRVVSVEEHWELRLSEPDPDRSAPQITMVMSPTGNVDSLHFLFTLNHNTVPDYAPGGVQVQVWDGAQFVQSQSAHNGTALWRSEEVVTWTQKISLQDGHAAFQVCDGDSQTWGKFGGDELSLSATSSLTGLNSYRPSVSLSESQVGYAQNRVGSLTLTKLIWVTDDGQTHEQAAPIPIDTSLDN
jgi:type V secretory pathway adhesin AidA